MNCHTCSQACHSQSSKPKWNWSFKSNRVTPNSTERLTTTIALVGSPNVGKSLLFNILTGTYVTVSNYPGTTVEISQGHRQKLEQALDIPIVTLSAAHKLGSVFVFSFAFSMGYVMNQVLSILEVRF